MRGIRNSNLPSTFTFINHAMEGLGVAANIIAVVELSAKVGKLCLQYSRDVSGARADIRRLHNQVEHLETALQAAQRLVEKNKDASLPISNRLLGSLQNCMDDLQKVEKKLEPNLARTVMRRYGLRALKWPFNSKEVDQLLVGLERHEKTILLGLQVDQTDLLVDIHKEVKQLTLHPTEDPPISHKPHFMVPFTPDPDFVHRPSIEKWMQEQYSEGAQRMALVGMGGFGKFKLAIQFAHKIHKDGAGTSVFWVHGASKATFEESYRALADLLALPRRHESKIDVLALVRDFLQRDDVQPWLMVLDNADDINVFFHDKGHNDVSQNLFASYLPKTAKGKILVTSRSLDAAERLVGSSKVTFRIPIMGEEQALELLQTKLEDKPDQDTAEQLVRTLDCIPLAINQAAAYINRRSPRVTAKSYMDEFCRSEKRKDSLLRSDKGDLARQDDVSNSVVVTWQVTFEQIRREQPRAANLLSLMSQFQPQNIPEFMLHGYDDDNSDDNSDDESEEIAFENDLDVLRGYSLVNVPIEGLLEMHSLVQFCTRSWISESGDAEKWNRLFIKLAASHFPSGAFETWAVCQRLLPHVEPLFGRKPREESVVKDWALVLSRVSYYTIQIGEYSRAEMLAKASLEARICILGDDHPSTSISRDNLASALWVQGQWEEAEKLQIEVLEISKEKLGLEHPNTLTRMANLASTLANQGRLEEAEELEIEVLGISKEKLGLEHPDTLDRMTNLASTLANQGRLEEAEELEIEVLGISKEKLGLEHLDTLDRMINLGVTHYDSNRLEEAAKLLEKALGTANTRLGPDHPVTLNSMHSLACTWHRQGCVEDAFDLMQECMILREQKLGHTHPDTQNSIKWLELWKADGLEDDSDSSVHSL
ncbi:kinesin light chain 3 [Fusarium beomiforme]|uniref:Kinesin light chain 3 n=1 Tax=Fusarium beomiforme TaxID=44412 RepID=A0A9P5AN45_9HYPO|nr:kinesin light chain 3 [Fusarium beomiforme]